VLRRACFVSEAGAVKYQGAEFWIYRVLKARNELAIHSRQTHRRKRVLLDFRPHAMDTRIAVATKHRDETRSSRDVATENEVISADTNSVTSLP
jgi:hypothetical protein